MDFALFLCFISFSIYVIAADATNIICPIQLYQFGDSISDTGNLVRINPAAPNARLPYGETFPGRPTGRASDGRLIIDYLAMFLGLPMLPPYLDKNASFTNGVDFAVGGATALNLSFFASRGVIIPPSPGQSLDLQLDWFRTYLASICSTTLAGCAQYLRLALFIVGEFGINDINDQLTQGKSIDEIRTTVPFINQAITNATRELIRYGAKRVVVPGNFPIGCFPFGLAALHSNDSNAYDELGCLKSLNNLVTYQNNNLQAALASLRREFPGVAIIYADYYNAFLSVFITAPLYGVDPATLLKPCCASTDFNVLGPGFCGNPGVPVCPNPHQYISWDGIHLTQEAYRRISQIVIPISILPATATICLP